MAGRRVSVWHPALLPDETARRCHLLMEAMIAYSAGMLEAVATFLASEPIVYLFGLVCLILAVKVVKDILH